jgi:hypothetical protein
LAGCGVDVQKSDRLRDILKPGFEKSLNSIGEVRFRASENLDPHGRPSRERLLVSQRLVSTER